jgi:hypothetical protein
MVVFPPRVFLRPNKHKESGFCCGTPAQDATSTESPLVFCFRAYCAFLRQSLWEFWIRAVDTVGGANQGIGAGGGLCLGEWQTVLWYQGRSRVVPEWCRGGRGVQEAVLSIANAYETQPQRADSELAVLLIDGWRVRFRGPGWGRKRTRSLSVCPRHQAGPAVEPARPGQGVNGEPATPGVSAERFLCA